MTEKLSEKLLRYTTSQIPIHQDMDELIKEVRLLEDALALCHQAWQQEYQSLCYEGGYSTLVEGNEKLTPEYWIEKAGQTI